jgi:hypothetical protein
VQRALGHNVYEIQQRDAHRAERRSQKHLLPLYENLTQQDDLEVAHHVFVQTRLFIVETVYYQVVRRYILNGSCHIVKAAELITSHAIDEHHLVNDDVLDRLSVVIDDVV